MSSSVERHGEHGSEIVRKLEQQESLKLPLVDARVQVFLAKLAFPNDLNPMSKWMEGEEIKDSLSRRYRAYIEDAKNMHAGVKIDVKNTADLDKLLQAVKNQEPETIH